MHAQEFFDRAALLAMQTIIAEMGYPHWMEHHEEIAVAAHGLAQAMQAENRNWVFNRPNMKRRSDADPLF
jgi:hypothetical protein